MKKTTPPAAGKNISGKPGITDPRLLKKLQDLDKQFAQSKADMDEIKVLRAQMLSNLKSYDKKLAQVTDGIQAIEKEFDTRFADNKSLAAATINIQEMQMSFNLQYLQLQQAMQNERV